VRVVVAVAVGWVERVRVRVPEGLGSRAIIRKLRAILSLETARGCIIIIITIIITTTITTTITITNITTNQLRSLSLVYMELPSPVGLDTAAATADAEPLRLCWAGLGPEGIPENVNVNVTAY